MNLVHATVIAATIFAAAQAHDGFVESYADAAATVPTVVATGNTVDTPSEPKRPASIDPRRADHAARGGMVAASTLSPVSSPSLR